MARRRQQGGDIVEGQSADWARKNLWLLHGLEHPLCAAKESSPVPLATFQRRQMSGAFRNVPSPLQGTSHRILSNCIASLCTGACVIPTSSFGTTRLTRAQPESGCFSQNCCGRPDVRYGESLSSALIEMHGPATNAIPPFPSGTLVSTTTSIYGAQLL